MASRRSYEKKEAESSRGYGSETMSPEVVHFQFEDIQGKLVLW